MNRSIQRMRPPLFLMFLFLLFMLLFLMLLLFFMLLFLLLPVPLLNIFILPIKVVPIFLLFGESAYARGHILSGVDWWVDREFSLNGAWEAFVIEVSDLQIHDHFFLIL